MKILFLITTIFCFAIQLAYSTEEIKLRKNSIGVAKVVTETKDLFTVKLTFPGNTFLNRPKDFPKNGQDYKGNDYTKSKREIILNGKILLFNEKGKISEAELKNSLGKYEYFCENDGGMQGWPTFILKLEKKKISKELKKTKYSADAFFIINPDHSIAKLDLKSLPIKSKILLKGDLDFDGVIETALVEFENDFDDPGCGNSMKDPYLDVFYNGGSSPLRCCGP